MEIRAAPPRSVWARSARPRFARGRLKRFCTASRSHRICSATPSSSYETPRNRFRTRAARWSTSATLPACCLEGRLLSLSVVPGNCCLVAEHRQPGAVPLYPHASNLQRTAALGLVPRPHHDGGIEIQQLRGHERARRHPAVRGPAKPLEPGFFGEDTIAVRTDDNEFVGDIAAPVVHVG